MTAAAADSAGRSFAGRAFEASPWAGDDGRAPQAFLDARGAFADGTGGPEAVLDSLRDARLLVPLLAQQGADDDPADARTRHTAELALPTVAGPDGRRVLPAFTSAEAMARWNAAARPVPASARKVALGAASDGTEQVIVDPGSPTVFGLRRGAVEALARGTDWVPAWQDLAVVDALGAAAGGDPEVLAVRVAAGDPGCTLEGAEVRVLLATRPRADTRELVERLRTRWAADPLIAARVDSISVGLAAS